MCASLIRAIVDVSVLGARGRQLNDGGTDSILDSWLKGGVRAGAKKGHFKIDPRFMYVLHTWCITHVIVLARDHLLSNLSYFRLTHYQPANRCDAFEWNKTNNTVSKLKPELEIRKSSSMHLLTEERGAKTGNLQTRMKQEEITFNLISYVYCLPRLHGIEVLHTSGQSILLFVIFAIAFLLFLGWSTIFVGLAFIFGVSNIFTAVRLLTILIFTPDRLFTARLLFFLLL